LDLIEWTQRVKENEGSAAKLYSLWEEISNLYSRGYLTKYIYEELRDLVFSKLAAISLARQSLEDTTDTP
jgi:hypothetical protein